MYAMHFDHVHLLLIPLNHSRVTLTPNPVFIFYFYLVSPVCVVLILIGVGCGAILWSVVNLLANRQLFILGVYEFSNHGYLARFTVVLIK